MEVTQASVTMDSDGRHGQIYKDPYRGIRTVFSKVSNGKVKNPKLVMNKANETALNSQ